MGKYAKAKDSGARKIVVPRIVASLGLFIKDKVSMPHYLELELIKRYAKIGSVNTLVLYSVSFS